MKRFKQDLQYLFSTNPILYFALGMVYSLFLYRTAIPSFKYPFFLLYGIFIVIILYKHKLDVVRNFRWLFKENKVILFIYLLLILSFLLSSKYYLVIFKDIFNNFVLLSFLFFLNLEVKTQKHLKIFIDNFLKIVVFIAIIISFNQIFNILNPTHSIDLIDYNFALIPIFYGLIILLLKNMKNGNWIIKVLKILLILVFLLTILFSGSKRGILLLLLGVVISIIFQFVSKTKVDNKWHNTKIKLRKLLYAFVFLLVLFSIYIFGTNYKFKNNLITIAGVENLNIFKHKVTQNVYRYFIAFEKYIDYTKLYNILWSSEFDSSDPSSGWGTRNHKVAFPLNGKNVEIVPVNVKGYFLDSTCEAIVWGNNAFSYTKVVDIKVKKYTRINASVYCYVSENFNGEWVRLNSEGDSEGDVSSYYNLENKGAWQKLEIQPVCDEGVVPVYLYFAKCGVTDFSSLKGYVIFAYPTYEITSSNDSISSDTLHSYSTILKSNKIHKKYSNANKSDFQKASIVNVFQKIPLSVLLQKVQDSDPIRNWVKNIFNEDTTYYGYEADINITLHDNKGIYSRVDRWRFAWEIYKKEYNWFQKIVGNGFDYLNWYGYYFYGDKTKADWPHNPFLSVLLYSGMLGLSLYLILLYKVISIYIRYIKEYYILFIFWGITFFFSFFSANSPFNPPVMGFFMMLPFFIDYIHKMDKSGKFVAQSKQK